MTQNYIRSLPQAFEVIKDMNLSWGWESDYRRAGRDAVAEILQDRMKDRIDQYLQDVGKSFPDRRNGAGQNWLTPLFMVGQGRIELPTLGFSVRSG
jgi:hypothetical protein